MKRFTKWPVLILLGLFLLSVLVRAGQFNQEYIANSGIRLGQFTNTEVFYHTEYVLALYDRYDASQHLFASYIRHDFTQFLQHKEIFETVYTSFPSAIFVVPYLVFELIHTPPTYLSLQIFSLALHLLCILLFYRLLLLLTKDRAVSVLAASAYIFATIALQHHMNVYWAHQLLQPLFIYSLILFVKREGRLRPWEILGLALAMSLITWTGVVASVGYALYGAWMLWRTRDRAYLSYLWAVFGVGLAMAAVYLQVFLATGANLGDYLYALSHRADARSSVSSPPSFLIGAFFNALLIDMGLFAAVLPLLAWKNRPEHMEWAVLFISTFPLLESFLLMGHDYTYGFGRLKWLVPLVLLIGILGAKFAKTYRRLTVLAIFIIIASAIHVYFYWHLYT